ncbi:MAG TPA: HTTM domain-containing protein, partial [Candidatus Obscuribacterales bacterium]
YYTARLEEYAHFPVPILFDHLSTCQLLTWGTLLIEFSLCTLIWSRRFRKYVLLIGVIFHLGIDWSMNIPLFEYIMIAYYLNFLEPAFVMRSIVFVRMRMNNWLKNARSGLRLAKNN